MSPSPRRPRRRGAVAVPLVLLGVVLSGCGVAEGDQVRPGVAARVDGTDVLTSDVDRLVDTTCDYLDGEEGAPAYPRVTVRRLFFETLVRRQAAESLVEELDAELPPDYTTAVREVDQSYPDLEGEEQEAMRDGDRALVYVAYAADAIGAALAEEEGAAPTDPASDAAAARQRGNDAIAAWLAERDVDLNPTYGFELRDGAFVADDGLAVAASDEALGVRTARDIDIAGAEDQQALQAAITEAVSSLPADQVCGQPAAS